MESFGHFEQVGWANKAADYDRLLGKITSRVVDHLLDAAGVTVGTRMLDLACGPGYAAARGAARRAVTVGVDLSPTMVELARTRYPALHFREASAEALPFAAGTFDAVVGNFLLHHLADPKIAVAECARVLKSGGRLGLTAWDFPEHARFVGILVDALAEVGPPVPADFPTGPPFFIYARSDAMTALFRSAGFRDVEVITVGFQHQIATADELWNGLMDGTVRMSALVLKQPTDVQEQIRAVFDRLTARHVRNGGLSIPVSAKLGVGIRA